MVQMELTFLGKGSAFNPIMKNTSAYFIYDNNFFLLDCGESVFEQIYNLKELRDCEHIYVLITHLHADHIGSLGSLISYCRYVLARHIYIIHPVPSVIDLLTLLGIDKENYIYQSDLSEDLQDIRVEAISVAHVQDMSCFGYLITAGFETIYYSGDASSIPGTILTRFLAGEINRLYQDTSTSGSDHPTHCYIGDLENMIPSDRRSFVYCMHLDGDVAELLQAKGFRIPNVKESV